jgi:hypothetical protein
MKAVPPGALGAGDNAGEVASMHAATMKAIIWTAPFRIQIYKVIVSIMHDFSLHEASPTDR